MVGPATDVPGSLADWRVPVHGFDAGAAVIGDEPDLDDVGASSAGRRVKRTWVCAHLDMARRQAGAAGAARGSGLVWREG